MPQFVFVNRFYAPDHSATAQILTDLCVHLAREGSDVHVMASRLLYDDPSVRLSSTETIEGVKVHRVWTSRFGRTQLAGRLIDYLSFYVSAALGLAGLIKRGDIVVAKTDPPMISVVAAMIARLKGARTVNWLQDLYPEVAERFGVRLMGGPVGAGLKEVRDASLRSASLNVAISDGMAARLVARGCDPRTVAVVHNWTDDESIGPQSALSSGLRKEWGFAAEDFVVCYSGNLGRAHDVETVLEAAKRLLPRPRIRFLFVGGGFHTAPLEKRVLSEGLTNVSFQPYQPREDLSESLAVADAHWLSLRPEFEGLIFPSKLYGIAAAGRPIIAIASPEGDLARVIADYGCGACIAPGDSARLAELLLTLASQPSVPHDLGERARRMLDDQFQRRLRLAQWSILLEGLAKAAPVRAQPS